MSPTPSRRRSLRDTHGVLIRARGGAELWWEITYAGVTKRFPGHVVLQDVLLCVLDHGDSCRGHREERFGA